MTLFDWIVALFLAFALYRGLKNGLIKEVFGLVGILMAVALALLSADIGGAWLQEQFEISESVARLGTLVTVFLLVLILFQFLALLFTKLIETLLLGPLNRLFGAIFSTLKATVILSLILFFLTAYNLPSQETRNSSLLYPFIEPFAPLTLSLLSDISPKIADAVEDFVGPRWKDDSWNINLPEPSLPVL
jgi:membrane protein required for colicin V production